MNYKNYLCVVKSTKEEFDNLKESFAKRQNENNELVQEYRIFEFQTPEPKSEEFLQWLADNTMISDNPNFSKVVEMFMGMALGFKRIDPPEQKVNISNPPNIYLLAERELKKDI